MGNDTALMKKTSILVGLDIATLRDLERVAPSRSRKRSEFIRAAVRKALDAEVERRMEESYRKSPDDSEPHVFHAGAWSAPRRSHG